MTTTDRAAPVSLVTGANKGLGLETVRHLVGAGQTVYLGARDEERGAAAGSAGARLIVLDVTSQDSVSRAAKTVEQDVGHLDLLVNNAGYSNPVQDVHDDTADVAAGVLLTNVVGYIRMIHAFLPLLEQASDPRIVNVSSGLGSQTLFHDPTRIESTAGTPFYSASKSAVNMLTARYAKLLPGIRINIADPGMTDTDLSGGNGHTVQEGTDAIIAFALGGDDTPTGAFRDRDGDLPW